MKLFSLFIIVGLVVLSGCTNPVGPTLEPQKKISTVDIITNTPEVVITPPFTAHPPTPTSTPYSAPTIEKITRSKYNRNRYNESALDKIVGQWGLTNVTVPYVMIVFTDSGAGRADYLSGIKTFSWTRDDTIGDVYSVIFDGEKSKTIMTYDKANDTISTGGLIFIRR